MMLAHRSLRTSFYGLPSSFNSTGFNMTGHGFNKSFVEIIEFSLHFIVANRPNVFSSSAMVDV